MTTIYFCRRALAVAFIICVIHQKCLILAGTVPITEREFPLNFFAEQVPYVDSADGNPVLLSESFPIVEDSQVEPTLTRRKRLGNICEFSICSN